MNKAMNKKNQANTTPDEFAFPKAWTLFGPVGRADPEPMFAGMNAIPNELIVAGKPLAGQKAAFTDNRLDLGALLGGQEVGKTAYLLASVEAEKATEIDLGAGADWWMKWWVNGEVVCDTLTTGNGNAPPSPADYRFKARLKAGKNLIAVKVDSGSGGFVLAAGGPREMAADAARVRALWRVIESRAEKMKTRIASGEIPDGLIYKPDQDLAKVKERFAAFWQGEIVDRVCLAVTAPNGAGLPMSGGAAKNDEQSHTDPEFQVRHWNAQFANTWYGGEALPMAWAPGQLLYATYGGKASFASGTVWVDPTLTDGQQWADYRFDPANPFIEHVVRITRALAEDAPGKYLVGSSGIFGPTDAMSMIRGMADFLMEIALPEYEAPLRHAHNECLAGFKHIVEAVYRAAGGHDGWFANMPCLWAPGRINNWSADWIYNIGPRQFEQWVLPEMQALSGMLEYSLYHLDGFNAVVHLPRMLEIPELTGMQFTRGAGHTLAEALPVYKQIQQGGKVQWIDCAPGEVEVVLRELDPRGLIIITQTPDIESAKSLLKNAETWSCRRHRG